jgi:hypothetical protein
LAAIINFHFHPFYFLCISLPSVYL